MITSTYCSDINKLFIINSRTCYQDKKINKLDIYLCHFGIAYTTQEGNNLYTTKYTRTSLFTNVSIDVVHLVHTLVYIQHKLYLIHNNPANIKRNHQ